MLSWSASRETNFKNYEIERSTDAVKFSFAGIVKGENFSNYSFTDNALPAVKAVFYWLKMVDMDGKISYSKIVSVRVSKLLSSAFPNPAKNTLTIKLPNNLKIASGLRVLDVVGRVALKQKISAMQNNIQLDVKTLPAGRYFVSINNKDIGINQSFVIPK